MTLYSGFSIEFCTAVAVVVTGVTLIYMPKKVVYIMHVERRHLREAWAQFTNSIWRPYFNVAERLRSDCTVILWSANNYAIDILTTKTKERYIVLLEIVQV